LQQAMHDDGAVGAQGNVVTGWVCICESMGPDGQRWLSKLSSDASGDARLATWAEQGLLWNALYAGGWDEDDDG
jgi:hypothetical protein